MVGSARRSPVPLVLVVLALACGPGLVRAQGTTTPAPAAPDAFRPRLVRSGTVSLGGQLLYGLLLGGPFSDDFNNGLGAGFNLRYRTAQDQAFGISFEAHNFGTKAPSDSAAGHDKLQIIVTTVDYTKFGSIRSRMPKYFQLGAGIAQTRLTDNDGEKEYPGDGGVFKLGAGMEYWANRSLSLDLGVRYYGVLLRSKLNHDLQVSLGFNFYTSP
jgi:opacity protein-like surface antigen